MAKVRRSRRPDPADEYLLDLDIQRLDEGGFVATSRQVQGLVAQGRTIAEAAEIARDVTRKIIESCIEHGEPPRRCRSAWFCSLRREPLEGRELLGRQAGLADGGAKGPAGRLPE